MPAKTKSLTSICHKCTHKKWEGQKILCGLSGKNIVAHSTAGQCPGGFFVLANLSESTPLADVRQLIDKGTMASAPGAWHKLPNIQQAYREALHDAAASIPKVPLRFSGDCIVTVGAGKYFPGAYVTIRIIRQSGCELPIELWMLEHERLTNWQLAALDGLGVTVRRPQVPVPGGWQLKYHAIRESAGRRVIFFDSDAYPFGNPAAAFSWREFIESGCVLWCDPIMPAGQPGCPLTPSTFAALGVPYRHEPSKDSGIVLSDKHKHWRGLWLADWMNRQHSHYYYEFVYGDKDLLSLAMLYLGEQPYTIVSKPWEGMRPGGMHFDLSGQPFAFHRFNGKFVLDGESTNALFPKTCQRPLRNDALPLEADAFGYIEQLRSIRLAHRPRIHGVFVCVNYLDYLEKTADANLPQADAWTVTTTADDPAVAFCRQRGINAVLSDRVHFAGSQFNLGALRNDAYRRVAETDPDAWIMSIDPDCIFPPDLRSVLDGVDLDPEKIYGLRRFGGEHDDHPCSGFFQLFHASQVRAGRLYREDWEDAGWTDVWFKDQWPADKQIVIAGAVVKHLGRPYMDHGGRLSPKADGQMATRQKTDQERWEEFHARPATTPDLDKELRWQELFARDLKSCGGCQADWIKSTKDYPPIYFDREHYARWGWRQHNGVTINKLKREPFLWPAACERYGWPASLYVGGPLVDSVAIFGLQRTGTNLAAEQISLNFTIETLPRSRSYWKHGRYYPHAFGADAGFVLCVRHPLDHLAAFYLYALRDYAIDDTLPPQFRADMTFADFLESPCYEFADPIDRWNQMHTHWLSALPRDRTALVRLEDQAEGQSWVASYINHKLALKRVAEVEIADKVDVNRERRGEPTPADLSIFTPELQKMVADKIDRATLAAFGYSPIFA